MTKKKMLKKIESLTNRLASVEHTNGLMHFSFRKQNEELTKCTLEKNALKTENDRLQRINNDNTGTT